MLLLRLQSPSKFTSAGTIAPASLSTSQVDIYILNGQDAAVGPAAQHILSYIAAGGGVVMGSRAWGYDGVPTPDIPANKVLM